jgi:hypothetical protein
MRTGAARNRYVPGDDATGRDVSYRDLLSMRADDVLEYAVRVKGIPEVIAHNYAVVADACELSVAVHHLPVVQRRKTAIPINESLRKSAAITGIRVRADNHAIIVEGSRIGMGCAREIWHGKKRPLAAAFENGLSRRVFRLFIPTSAVLWCVALGWTIRVVVDPCK